MTKKLKFIGAALVALAILPAAVLLFHLSLGTVFSLALGIGGYTLLGYESFQIDGNFGGGYTGGTTPPTQAQSVNGRHGRRAIDRHRYRYHVYPDAQFQLDGGASIGVAAPGADYYLGWRGSGGYGRCAGVHRHRGREYRYLDETSSHGFRLDYRCRHVQARPGVRLLRGDVWP